MGRLKDVLERQSTGTFVGREEEIELLSSVLSKDGPLLVCMHGIAGIGKSRLLEAFAEQARLRGATVVRLDCRQMEPTENGLLRELSSAIGSGAASIEQVTARLSQLGPVVLALDTYEVFRLLDSWLRQVFIPALPDNVRMILCRQGCASSRLDFRAGLARPAQNYPDRVFAGAGRDGVGANRVWAYSDFLVCRRQSMSVVRHIEKG